MKRILIYISITIAVLCCMPSAMGEDGTNENSCPSDYKFKYLDSKKCQISDLLYLISRVSQSNILVTEKAGKKTTRIFLNNVTARQAVESICRMASLWYREDEDGILRVMTAEEYARDLKTKPEITTEIITLTHADVGSIAQKIKNLYSDRVQLNDDRDESESNSTSNRAARSIGSSSFNDGIIQTGGITSSRKNSFSAKDTVSAVQRVTQTIDQAANAEEDIEKALEESHPLYQIINITVSRSDSKILIRSADKSAVLEIVELIKKLDEPTPQVLLEVKILDIRLTDGLTSVFDFSAAGDNLITGPQSPVIPSWKAAPQNTLGLGNFENVANTLVYQFLDDNIRARIQMFKQDDKITSLGTPILLCANNKKSNIFVGEERPLLRSYAVTTTTADSGVTNQVLVPEMEMESIGTQLEIVPRINADRSIVLDITQTVSTLNKGSATIPVYVNNAIQNVQTDTVKETTVKATIIIKDKLTVALGGLVRDEETDADTGVPLLKDIPIAGVAFRQKVTNKNRVEQIMLITPHVMTDVAESAEVTREKIRKLSKNDWLKSSDSPLLFPDEKGTQPEPVEKMSKTKKVKKKIFRFFNIGDN